jgi:hypothetical protein
VVQLAVLRVTTQEWVVVLDLLDIHGLSLLRIYIFNWRRNRRLW